MHYPRRRQSRGYGVQRRLCVGCFVCLSLCFPHDISKRDAACIAKLDLDMVQHTSLKSIYFGVKISKVNVKRHKNKSLLGFRRNATSTLAAYVSYAGFPPRPMLLPANRRFSSVRGVLASGKNIAGVGHALL